MSRRLETRRRGLRCPRIVEGDTDDSILVLDVHAGLDQTAKLITRLARDLDSWHRLELRERHSLAAPSLLDRLLRPLPSTGNPVENFSDPRGIGIGFVQRTGEK